MNPKKILLNIMTFVCFISLLGTAKADIYKDNNIPDDIKTKIQKIVDSPSHMEGIDGFRRKPRKQRIKDNIRWYKKYGKVNDRYNAYCLDIENFGNQNNFIDSSTGLNPQENIDKSQIKFSIDNKLSLQSAVRKKYKDLSKPVYFRFKGEKILDFKYSEIKNCTKTRSALKKLPDGKFFIKPQSDCKGKNAMILVKTGEKLKFTHVSRGEISLREFLKITSCRAFFVQDYIEQHEALKALNPTTLNTIRLITTKFNKKPRVLCAGLRMGKNTKTIVDNASRGGIFVGINAETGKLKKYGFSKHGHAMKEHPESKIQFEDYQLPFWKECISAAKKFHMLNPGYTSVGWDIAITPKGPVLIEGNSGWGGYIPNTTCRGIRKLWERNKRI